MRQTSLIFTLSLTLGAIGVKAQPGPSAGERLTDAENSYLFGDYPRVVELVTPLVVPNILLAQEADLARAYRLLGLAHFFLDEPQLAQRFFERLIRLRPDSALDPVRTPPPVVALFNRLKAALAAEISRTREALRREKLKEAEQRRLANTLLIRRDYRVNSRLVAALPFGIGQFQNGDNWLGGLFLGTQVAALSVSIASFIAIEDLRASNGRFRTSDVDRARTFQQVQLVSASVALGAALLGIVEAMLSFRERRFINESRKTGFQGRLHFTGHQISFDF
ncbi:MAG: hypothetical protein VX589_17740 [Myxococcota bacterium]|nr:hypothetical protein [Myxococcota bacterium]